MSRESTPSPVLPGELTLRLLQASDLAAAQEVFDATPSYHRMMLGQVAPADIARRCFEQQPPAPKKGIRVFKRLLGIERRRAVGDERGPELIGLMDLYVGYPGYQIATLALFVLRESLQRRGYGTAALGELRAWLRSHHPAIEWLDCSVTDDNLAGTRFLIKSGFERTNSWHEVEVAGKARRVIRLEHRLRKDG